MKIINDTGYAKGYPNMNYGYCNPNTKEPYSSIQEANTVIKLHIPTIPTGFTVCAIGDNKMLEYWWNGSEWILKVDGGAPSDSPDIDFSAVYLAIIDGDAALRLEIENIIRDLNALKTLPAVIDDLKNRVTDNEEAIRRMLTQIDNINAGGGNPDPQNPVIYVESRTFIIYSTSNATPTGGSYNFTTKVFNPPTGWSTDVPNTDLPVYFSTGTAYSDSNTIKWGIPTLLIVNGASIITGVTSAKTYPAQIYTSSTTLPNTPLDGTDVVFDIGSKTVSCPQNSVWRTSPASSNENEVKIDVWVSYTNYVIEDGSNSATPTGWTTPLLYMDLDGILNKAAEEAQEISDTNLELARQNIESAVNTANSKISEMDSLKTQLQQDVTSALNNLSETSSELDLLASLAQTKIEEARQTAEEARTKLNLAQEIIDLIESGGANVGGLLTEVAELKGQIRTYGWSADSKITNYHWELDGTTVNNIPNLEVNNELKLNEVISRDGIYFIIRPTGTGECKLFKTNDQGVREVANDAYITVTYNNGAFVVNSDLVTSVLVCKGEIVTGELNYADRFFSAAEKLIYDKITSNDVANNTLRGAIRSMTDTLIVDKVDSVEFLEGTTNLKASVKTMTDSEIASSVDEVVLKHDGSSLLNSSIATQTARQINFRVFGTETDSTGSYKDITTSIIDLTKKSIKLEVAGSNFQGSLTDALLTVSEHYIDLRIAAVSLDGDLNQSSIHMTPEQIVLSAINSNNVVWAIYDRKDGNWISEAIIGDTYKTNVVNGKRYVYKENPTKYITVSNGSLVENNELTEFNGYLKYITLNGATASEAMQTIASNEIVSKVWGNNNQTLNGESYSLAIQRITKTAIANEISEASNGNMSTAISNLKASIKLDVITEINTGEGEVNQTSLTMTPEQIVLSAVNSNNIVYKLYEIVNDTPNLITSLASPEYIWTKEDGEDYFLKRSNNKYYYISNHQVVESNSKVAFGGKIEYGIAEGATIKGSFINMLSDSLSLNVANSNNNATITLKATENGSTINLASGTVTVTGDMIASAITTKRVNINNKTYLNSDGSVQMGMGTDGSSAFNIDGTGYLAGGLIHWGSKPLLLIYSDSTLTECVESISVTISNGVIRSTGKYIDINGNSIWFVLKKDNESDYYLYYTEGGTTLYAVYNGGWTTSTSKTYLYTAYYEGSSLTVEGLIKANGGHIGGWDINNQALVGAYNSKFITLMPSAIYSGNIAPTSANHPSIGWCLQNDGSGWLASNRIKWNTSGNGNINDQFIWDEHTFTLKTSQYNGPNSDYNGLFIQIRGLAVNDMHDYEPTLEMGTYSSGNGNYQLTISPNKITLGANSTAQLWVLDDSSVHAVSMVGGSSKATFNASGILLKNIKKDSTTSNKNAGALLAIGASDASVSVADGLTETATNAIFMQSVKNDVVLGYVLVNPNGITVSNPVGGQILVDRKGVSINSTDSTSTPYIVLNNANTSNTNPSTIGIYSNSLGNRINVTSTDIQMLAGVTSASPTTSKALEIIDSSGIRLFANASKSNELWDSDVSLNINEKGIGLFANYTLTVNSTTNYKVSALIVSKGTGGLNPDNVDLATTKIESDSGVSSSGRVALVSANTTSNGYISSLNAYLSVNSDGIYGGGSNFRFGSNNNKAKLYILEDLGASIVIGNVEDPKNISANPNNNFISFNKNDGSIVLKGGGGSNKYILISSSGITIGADVKINASVTANKLLIADINNSSTTDFAGITGEKYKNASAKSDDDRVIWSGGSRESSPTFYVTRDGRIYGLEGTLSVINNNHITNYSDMTVDQCDAFIRLSGKYDDFSNVFVLDPHKLGDVVYLPSVNNGYSVYYLLLPFAYVTNPFVNGETLNLSISGLTECVGRRIILIAPKNSKACLIGAVSDANIPTSIYYHLISDPMSSNYSDYATYNPHPNWSGSGSVDNSIEICNHTTSGGNPSTSSGMAILDICSGSYNGYIRIFSAIKTMGSWSNNYINVLSTNSLV